MESAASNPNGRGERHMPVVDQQACTQRRQAQQAFPFHLEQTMSAKTAAGFWLPSNAASKKQYSSHFPLLRSRISTPPGLTSEVGS